MSKQTVPPLTTFLAPKYWPTWLGISIVWLIAYLPFSFRIKVGSALGYLTYRLAKERRYITHLNFTLCFPELSAQDQNALTRKCFRENGIGLIETTTSWVRAPEHFKGMLTLIGTEHMNRALAKGKGVLLLGAHYSTLDFSANLLSQHYPFGTTYRPHKNPLFDAFMLRGRLRNCNGVFDRNDIRGAFKHLRKGLVLWYAPDQDYGPSHSVIVPFFGLPAATITAASRFASFNNSTTLLVRHHRLGDTKRYELEFIPVPEEFPCEDIKDASLINNLLEAAIRTCPEQYLWMHKRFKTQAKGKPASPYIDIKTSSKIISAEHYNKLIEDSQVLEDIGTAQSILHLKTGMHLRLFPKISKPWSGLKHPAKKFDYYAKRLRMNNIASITCDVIYKVPEKNLTAVAFFPTEGNTVSSLSHDELPLQALATLFAKLHQHGFQLSKIKPDKLLLNDQALNIQNPEDIKVFPTSLSYINRCDNLLLLLSQLSRLELKKAGMTEFCDLYLEASALGNVSEFKTMLARLPDRTLSLVLLPSALK